MLKIILWSGGLIAIGMILRRTRVLENVKNSLFKKVDSLTGTSGATQAATAYR